MHRGEFNEVRELMGNDAGPDEAGVYSILSHAVMENSFEMAELLIFHGANVNGKDSRGETLLHQATSTVFTTMSTERHNIEDALSSRNQVQMLVLEGADVSITNKEGWTVLHKAAYNGNVAVVQWLLKDVLPNDIVVDIFAKTDAGETAQQLSKLNVHPLARAAGPNHQIVALLESASLLPKSMAFAMGLHPRLGAGSVVIGFDPELLRMVLELVLDRVE
jgi:ankyrin repeat protein